MKEESLKSLEGKNECPRCGIYTNFMDKIREHKSKKIIRVCTKCTDMIRNKNIYHNEDENGD